MDSSSLHRCLSCRELQDLLGSSTLLEVELDEPQASYIAENYQNMPGKVTRESSSRNGPKLADFARYLRRACKLGLRPLLRQS